MADAPTYVHRKSGGHYTLLGTGRLQSDTPLADMAEIAIYRGEDGRLWARDALEFAGRFDPATPSPPVAAPPATPGVCTACIPGTQLCRWHAPQPQPAQPLTGAAPIAYSLQWPGDVELGRINISTTFDTEKEAREYADGCLHAETIRVVALITAPSTPTPPEVAP